MIGQTISHYRILQQLGEGGMGVVYLAEDTILGRRVAVKFLSDASGSPSHRARFLREARAASALDHPHIARIYDYGETPHGQPFIVMELVGGQTLYEMLATGALDLERAAEIVEQVAEALGEAHRHGIIHRDIKPSNVALNERGEVKVLDFGLAKQLTSEREHSSAQNAPTLVAPHTRSGVIMGTPLYMSPEQAKSEPVDARSDIFSLGAVLYECCGGRPPFSGLNFIEICAQVMHPDPPPPPSHFNPRIPRKLDDIILKALAKDPAGRYQLAADFAADLRAVRPKLREAGEPAPRRVRPRLAAARIKSLSNLSENLQRPRLSLMTLIASLALTLLATLAFLQWLRQVTPHQPSVDAQKRYAEGTDAMRDGTYYKATKLLGRAVEADGDYALAHARLAEAWTELDYADRAKDEIMRAGALASGRSPLSPSDALYVQAITAIVMGDFPRAITLYSEILSQAPAEERTHLHVDLGRAYEKNEDVTKAIENFQQATNLDANNAAAHLWLGILYGRQRNLASAMEVFERAEKHYETVDNIEGQAEVRYQRGSLLNKVGRVAEARAQLERVIEITRATKNDYQQIRAMLQLSSIAYVQGSTTQAKQYAADALELAQREGLENLTTQGLIDLGGVYSGNREYDEAEQYFKKALAFASRYEGQRNKARALLALGKMFVEQEINAEEGLRYVEEALVFFQRAGYRKEASQALLLRGRAKLQRGEYAQALEVFDEQLRLAEQLNDPAQLAYSHLLVANALADREIYPEAIRHFERSYEIHKSLGNHLNTGYSLLGRGDMLWRLGRAAEAREALGQISAITDRLDGKYKQALGVRVHLVNSQMALSERRFSDAKVEAGRALALAGTQVRRAEIEAKSTLGLAQALSGGAREGNQNCDAAVEMAKRLSDPRLLSNALLALAGAQFDNGKAQEALNTASQAQEHFTRGGQAESEWRARLIAARASQQLGNTEMAREQFSRARALLASLQQSWGEEAFNRYLARPDVQFNRQQLDRASVATNPT